MAVTSKSEKEWMIIAFIAGAVAGVSIYGPFPEPVGLWAYLFLVTALAGWVSFRRPEEAKPLLGLMTYGAIMYVSMPLWGWVLNGQVGNLWGLVGIIGMIPATIFYFVVERFIRA